MPRLTRALPLATLLLAAAACLLAAAPARADDGGAAASSGGSCDGDVCSTAIPAAIDWLRSKGGFVGDIAFRSSPLGGNGVFATADLPADSKLLSVPLSTMLNLRAAQKSELAAFLNFHTDQPDEKTNLAAIYLLWELRRGEDSPYAPFLATLPSKAAAASLPLFWTDDERELLRGSSVLEYLTLRDEGATTFYNEHAPRLFSDFAQHFSPEAYSLDDFKWALSMGWSRVFGVPHGADFDKLTSFVPLGDQFNFHLDYSVVSKTNEEGTLFEFFTTRAVKAGEELTANYAEGVQTATFMLDYGFSFFTDGDDDHVQLTTPPTVLKHADTLSAYKLLTPRLPLFKSLNPYVTAVFRLVSLTPSERAKFNNGNPGVMLTRRNERDAARRMLALARRALRRYNSSLQEDEASWARVDELELTQLARHALVQRINEKRILNSFADAVDAYLQTIDDLPPGSLEEQSSSS
eukprot:PLAT5586.1.p1 GENE.PLAT5586.1~~PLAT5586.1.p1  ORF type:complete len:477 (+),score=273.65 PLAT5586.1:37-1431(+)